MRSAQWTLCLWPGLPGLWQQGRWRSLGVALAFSAFLNGMIWATAWQPAGIPSWVLAIGWAQIGGFWIVSAWNSHQEYCRRLALPKSQQLDAWFRDAQRNYLRGHWIDAESRLREILEFTPADVESRLLLAAVYRRADRLDDAQTVLRELNEWPQAEAWKSEREALARNS